MQKPTTLLISILLAAIILAGGWYVLVGQKLDTGKLEDGGLTACPQDVKLCPDGSTVARTGPNCEFAECQTLSVGQTDVSDWKTYRNEEYGFEFKYPAEWTLVPSEREHDFEHFPTLAYFSFTNYPVAGISLEENLYHYGFEDVRDERTITIDSKKSIIRHYADNPCGGLALHIPHQNNFLVVTVSDCAGKCDPEGDPEGLEPLDCKIVPAMDFLLKITSSFKFID